MPSGEELQRGTVLMERVKAILETRSLTMHQVSLRSAEFYGASSPFFLPHNLYHSIRRGSFSPALHQFCALSRITGYGLLDWLRVFDFAPERILELQAFLPRKRTILLDASLDDPDPWMRRFQDAIGNAPSAPIMPLGQLPQFSLPTPQWYAEDFLYARIGSQDALAFPELLPGSIVRVNPHIADRLRIEVRGRTLQDLFLIEHSNGLWCCRVHLSSNGGVVPISSQLPYASVELQIPNTARVLGVVDMEIRRAGNFQEPDVSKELTLAWNPQQLTRQHVGLGPLLRKARSQSALSFREASALSRKVAEILGDQRYFASPGSLSDFEGQSNAPRHFHKVITLCALYGIRFADFVAASGIALEELGREAIPLRTIATTHRAKEDGELTVSKAGTKDPNLPPPTDPFEKLPFFLQPETLAGTKATSFRDVFGKGEESSSVHPSLRGVLLLVVNRHKKKPFRSAALLQWQQPLYLLFLRDGSYLCASCSLENGNLVIYSNLRPPERLRNHQDAEVIGEVVAVVRRVS